MKTSKQLLTSYVGDILAAENHLLKAIEQQLSDEHVARQSVAHEFLRELRGTLQTHSFRLAERLSALGGSLTANVKEAVTAATGFAAGLFGRIRPQIASKFLRDDYVVLSACAIEYEMLHVMALAMKEQPIADMALQHLKEITPLIVRLSDILPGVVVQELGEEVGDVATGSVLVARENTRRAWSNETVHSQHA
jgi:hypothetical protein